MDGKMPVDHVMDECLIQIPHEGKRDTRKGRLLRSLEGLQSQGLVSIHNNIISIGSSLDETAISEGPAEPDLSEV